MAATTPSATAPVKSALRTLDVIEFVVAHRGGVAAQELGSALGIPMSSLSYLLATLAERGYLHREGRKYVPGPGLERLRVAEDALSIPDRVTPLVRAIRGELNETVSFMVRNGWEAEVVVTEVSDRALRYAIEPGERKPLHAFATGKAILAMLSPDELDQYFAQSDRVRFTGHTIVDEAGLRTELDRIRASGFAEAEEESTPGISSIGAPILIGGVAAGGIGIAVPSIRFTAELRLRARELLGRAARALA